MKKQEKQIEAYEMVIELLQKKIEKLKEEVVQSRGGCAPGYYRNEAGQCVVDSRS